jgi:hypothetical protein
MGVLVLILIILALVLAGLRAFGVTHPRIHFGWLAVALVLLAYILANLGQLTGHA